MPVPQKQPGTTNPADSKRLCILGLCALIILILFIPVFGWIHVVNTEALYEVMNLKSSVIKKLTADHPVLTFLSYVETSKQGVLGFWSFLLLIISAAAIIFCLMTFVRYLRSGNPSLSSDVKTSSPFSPSGSTSPVFGSMISA